MNAIGLSVTVQNVAGADWMPSDDQFARWVEAAIAGSRGGEVNVRIVNEAESAVLNARFRDRSGATNVLAFASDPELAALDPDAPVGDLVICADVIEREAAIQSKPREAHLAHIVVHGALHLAGHDHQTAEDAEAMERLERQVLRRFSIPDPYETPSR